jgi:hypothetical protein
LSLFHAWSRVEQLFPVMIILGRIFPDNQVLLGCYNISLYCCVHQQNSVDQSLVLRLLVPHCPQLWWTTFNTDVNQSNNLNPLLAYFPLPFLTNYQSFMHYNCVLHKPLGVQIRHLVVSPFLCHYYPIKFTVTTLLLSMPT